MLCGWSRSAATVKDDEAVSKKDGIGAVMVVEDNNGGLNICVIANAFDLCCFYWVQISQCIENWQLHGSV